VVAAEHRQALGPEVERVDVRVAVRVEEGGRELARLGLLAARGGMNDEQVGLGFSPPVEVESVPL
jgi:hypothetical protein